MSFVVSKDIFFKASLRRKSFALKPKNGGVRYELG